MKEEEIYRSSFSISIIAAFFICMAYDLSFWIGVGIAIILGSGFLYVFTSLFSDEEENGKDCPFCAERIKAKAVRCKHCQSDLN